MPYICGKLLQDALDSALIRETPLHVRLTVKSVLSATLAAAVLASGPVAASFAAAPYKGRVIQTDQHNNIPSINEDDVREVPEGADLELVLSSEITLDVNSEGDEFFAKLARDYKVDGAVVIPRGTIMHGTVEKLEDRKRAGRNAYINTRFDYMITPDGREIPLEGEHTTRDNKLKAAAKVVGKAAGYTAVGGAIGALMVVKYGGLPAIVASEGYAVAGGAAVGATVGLTAAMLKKGKSAQIPAGAMMSIRLAEPLVLPTMEMPDAGAKNFTIDGLKFHVLATRMDKDPFGTPNELTLTVDIANYTEHSFSSFDIALEDEYGTQFFPSPFGDSGMMFQKLRPNARMSGNITFNVNNPTVQHYLVFYKQYSRQPLAKIALTEAMQIDKKTAKDLEKAMKR